MWQKGQSGNPKGKKPYTEEQKFFIAKCQNHLEKAWKILEISIASNNWEKQKWATEILLDRALGKPETTGSLEVTQNEPPSTPEQLIAGYREFKALIAARTNPIPATAITNGVEPGK